MQWKVSLTRRHLRWPEVAVHHGGHTGYEKALRGIEEETRWVILTYLATTF
jgi:hypothetical protein